MAQISISEKTLKRAARVIDESMNVRVDKHARILVNVWSGDVAGMDALEIISGRRAYNRREDRKDFRLSDETAIGQLLSTVRPYVKQKDEIIDAVLRYLQTTDPDEATVALLMLGDLCG